MKNNKAHFITTFILIAVCIPVYLLLGSKKVTTSANLACHESSESSEIELDYQCNQTNHKLEIKNKTNELKKVLVQDGDINLIEKIPETEIILKKKEQREVVLDGNPDSLRIDTEHTQ